MKGVPGITAKPLTKNTRLQSQPAVAASGQLGAVPDGQGEIPTRGSWILFAFSVIAVAGGMIAMFLPLVPKAIGTAGVLTMVALIFLRVPIGLAMTIPALLGLYALRGIPAVEGALASMPFDVVANWSLSVIPMFVLLGLLMWKSGVTNALYDAGRLWLGKLPGGLAIGTNLAGAVLSAVSGSTIGTTYALARIGIPEMLKSGYDKRLAIGAVIAAGLPGQLIPPSIMLVIYAGIVEIPVGPALLAGVGPGILVAFVFTIAIMIFATRWARGQKSTVVVQKSTGVDRLHVLTRIWPVPLLIAVIMGGMFSGMFTATEAGAVAALGALAITLWWRRKDAPLRGVREAAMATVSSVGAIFFMLIGVEMLTRMLTLTGISSAFATWVQGLELGRVGFLLLMMVIYILLGTFMEGLPMMLLTTPILMPTIASLDISLFWFGAFVVFMGELAILTPPVGILAFVIHSITKEKAVNQGQNISLNDVFNSAWWFMPFAILVTVLLILFPEIATYLPDLASENTGP